MSLVTIVQQIALKVLSTSPSSLVSAVSSTDPNIQDIIALVNEDGQELSRRAEWQALRREGVYASVGIEDQGSIQSFTGPDFGWVIPETMWDRTTRRPVFGPKTAAEWQQLKAQQMQGPWFQYTLRGNHILWLPIPPVGDQVYFEWMSRYWCQSQALVNQPAMIADTDVSLLDEQLHVLGGIFRFRQNRRLAYQEDEDKYEAAVMDNLTRDGIKSRLNLAGAVSDVYPGILVPSGNWPIP